MAYKKRTVTPLRPLLTMRQFKHQAALRNIPYSCVGDDIIQTERLDSLEALLQPTQVNALTIFTCLEGTIECIVSMTKYTISANQVLVLLPGVMVQVLSSNNVQGYALLVSMKYMRNLRIDFHERATAFMHVAHYPLFSLNALEMQQMRQFYNLYHTIIKAQDIDLTRIIHSLSTTFAYVLIQIIKKSLKLSDDLSGNDTTTRNKQIFDNFVSALTDYRTSERTVRFYAERLCLTPKYLSHAVKEYTGRGALDWINDAVLLEAKTMLRRTDLPIKEIAYKLNFQTQSAFGKYFRQQLGVGPKDYRRGTEPMREK